jgi:hypothetical protein
MDLSAHNGHPTAKFQPASRKNPAVVTQSQELAAEGHGLSL